jgi:large conductance mechanosensitive channel
MWEEFKKFAFRGNVIDLAVGVVIGAAFSAIVKSLVDNLIMPPIGYMLGGVDFADLYLTLKAPVGAGPFATPEDMVKAGAVLLRYGLFANAIVSFFLVAASVFLLVKSINKLSAKPPADPTTKECPLCLSQIPIKASKCCQCTADLV